MTARTQVGVTPMDHGRTPRADSVDRWSSRTTALVITLAALLFGYFVWPSPWVYLSHQLLATRVHRVTGHAQVLTADGWRAVGTDYVEAVSERVMRERRSARLERQLIGEDLRMARGNREAGQNQPRSRRVGARGEAIGGR